MVRADYDLWNDVFMGKDTNQEAKQVSDFLWQASRGGVEKDATRYSSNPNIIVPYKAGEVVGGKPGFETVKPVSAMDIDKTFETDMQRKKNLAADEQEKIDSIIGINYDVFISTSVFSDDQNNCFLEADLADKRSIIENLLSLDIYRKRFEYSKNLLKENKTSLKQLISEYEILDNNKLSLFNFI